MICFAYYFNSYSNEYNESFISNGSTESKIKIYTTFPMNHDTWTGKSLNMIDYNELINNYISLLNPSFYFICDPLDYEKTIKYIKNVKLISDIEQQPIGYFIILMKNDSPHFSINCDHDLNNKKIGYFDRTDLYFINALMNAYRIDPENYILQQMTIDNFNISNVDYVITYVILNSSFHKWIMNQHISIYGFKNIDIDRLKIYSPFISSTSASLQTFLLYYPNEKTNKLTPSIFYPKAIVKNVYALLPTLKMNIVKFNNTYNSNEKFVNQYIDNTVNNDIGYNCEGKDSNLYKTKQLCTSKYGFYDLKKPNEAIIWDKHCKYNYECPYYKANTNYTNNRGGCLPNRECEFPLGIKKLGYTQYDDTEINSPFCYGCNGSDINCCKKQKNPDYIFSNDQEARKKAGLSFYNSIII